MKIQQGLNNLVFFFRDINMNFGLINNNDIIVQTLSVFICQTINPLRQL